MKLARHIPLLVVLLAASVLKSRTVIGPNGSWLSVIGVVFVGLACYAVIVLIVRSGLIQRVFSMTPRNKREE